MQRQHTSVALLSTATPPACLPGLPADVHRAQGVLCWQAGMLGAALSWLARCGDVQRLEVVLAPLASSVSGGRLSEQDRAALEALQPVLQALPPGSSNAALLAVHRLLKKGEAAPGGDGRGGSMHAAVAALAQLPEAMRDSCLQLVCAAVPAMPPGALSEPDVVYLLQWLLVSCAFCQQLLLLFGAGRVRMWPAGTPGSLLSACLPGCWMQSAEGRLPMGKQRQAAAAGIQVARLALVRSLAASHMTAQQGPALAAGSSLRQVMHTV